ncbi:hypothetical protein NDU88_008923, partial [Pleurodeles waltl]
RCDTLHLAIPSDTNTRFNNQVNMRTRSEVQSRSKNRGSITTNVNKDGSGIATDWTDGSDQTKAFL